VIAVNVPLIKMKSLIITMQNNAAAVKKLSQLTMTGDIANPMILYMVVD
jgi:hypothetical protein